MDKKDLFAMLKAYIEWRRQDLEQRMATIAQPNAAGIGTAVHAEVRDGLRRSMAWLGEMREMVRWAEDGEPEYQAPLSEDEKEFWRKAMQRGIEIPGDIKAQL